MRAAVISELGRVPELTDWPEPSGESVYDVSAVALNPADINIGAGRYFAGHPELPCRALAMISSPADVASQQAFRLQQFVSSRNGGAVQSK